MAADTADACRHNRCLQTQQMPADTAEACLKGRTVDPICIFLWNMITVPDSESDIVKLVCVLLNQP